jgi:hypothetical protein
MKLRCWVCCLVSGAIAMLLLAMNNGVSEAADKIDVLIVDGQNNHDFVRTTPYLKKVLESTGRFRAFVVTTPPRGAEAGAWKGFRPQFSDYHVVLSNYNGETWPEHARTAYEEFVLNGGGVMNVHAANNPFPDWPAWNDMVGLGWRDNKFGDRITVDADGKQVRTAKGEGPGAGHGKQHPFTVITRDREHPIMKGLPQEWMHPQDELYHGQRGPGNNMNILATAFSSKESGGTGDHEPMVWWIPAGKGRVVTTVLGHVGGNQDQESWPMRCAGFQAIVTRGTEWAATGEVTIELPKELPTAEKVSLLP